MVERATEGGTAAAGSAVEELVLVQRVKLLHQRSSFALPISILNAALVALACRGIATPALCAAWLGYMCVVAALRVCEARLFARRRGGSAASARRWARLYALGAGLNGLGWGAFAAFCLPRANPAQQGFVAFAVGGMAAGAAITNATYPLAVASFVVPSLLPVMAALAAAADAMHLAMAATTAAFAAGVARSGGAAIAEAIRLRFCNEALLADQQAAQAVLHEAEEELRLTIDHAPIGIGLVAVDGRFVRVNLALCELAGYASDELLRLSLLDLAPRQDRRRGGALAARMLRGELARHSSSQRCRRKDGRVADVQVHASLLRDDAGQPRHFIVQIEDVTERKRVEAELVAKDRLASVGTLASGVAHEINNPLSYLLSNLRYVTGELAELERELPGRRLGEARQVMGEAVEGGERIRRIVQDLRAFSRSSEQLGPVDVHRVFELAINIAASQIRYRARLVRDYADLPPVQADESRLSQVFLNLLINAAQSIPEGRPGENEIRVVMRRDGAGRVVVEVRDTGCGIAPEVRGRIFEPFFTTKPLGVGTGLGLSICHGIVSAMGGEITVETELGRGSTFRVALPVAAQGVAEPASQARALSLAGTGPG